MKLFIFELIETQIKDFFLRQKSQNKNRGNLKDFKLVLHGTYDQPEHMKNGPRKYAESTDEITNEEVISPENKAKTVCYF